MLLLFMIFYSLFKNVSLINFDVLPDVERTVHFVSFATGLRWCTASPAEYKKCTDLENTVRFAYSLGTTPIPPLLLCVSRSSAYECMRSIEQDEADVAKFEAGEVYLAGILHGLVPISVEEYGGPSAKEAVIIVRKNVAVEKFDDLENKTLCSPGAGSLAGWIIPITKLLQLSTDYLTYENRQETISMRVIDCNNMVKSASAFFGPSCIPNILDSRHNLKGDNPGSMCSKCAEPVDSDDWCTSRDPYAGSDGVLNCLVHGGQVGFLSADLALKLPLEIATEFEFLCPNGKTAPLAELTTCSWGTTPGDAFVVSSAKSTPERILIQQYIYNLTRFAGQIFSDKLPGTSGRKYNRTDLMWSDTVSNVRSLTDSEQTAKNFLGEDLFTVALGERSCPQNQVKLCVVGLEEYEKCMELQTAFSSKNLRPFLTCILAKNHWDCMQRVSAGHADVMMADASDAYLAGALYGMVPFMIEMWDNDDPYHYAVAVVKRIDTTTTLLDLRNRRTCHGKIYGALGWSVPVSFLLTQNRVRPAYDCQDLTYQVSQIFQKACAPGALITAHYRSILNPETLCDLCMGDIENYCMRNPMEPYYGDTGAFKCLVEGGGHVAFVSHQTPRANTDGRNLRLWSRALVSQDYQLLCEDGTRSVISDYRRCNLGKVPASAMMTSSRFSEEKVAAFASVFEYAQAYFGSSHGLDMRMFESSGALNQDLIFSDATTRLVRIPLENRTVEAYLGEDFIRLIRRSQCSKASKANTFSDFLITMNFLFAFKIFLSLFNVL